MKNKKWIVVGAVVLGLLVALGLGIVVRRQMQISKARSPNTSFYELAQLAVSSDESVRRAVAMNPHTAVDLLRRLAQEPNLQYAVIANPAAPGDLVETLALGPPVNVQLSGIAALNPNASDRLLRTLAKSDSPAVRSFVAQNAHAASDVMVRLMNDPDKNVRDTARATVDAQRRQKMKAPAKP